MKELSVRIVRLEPMRAVSALGFGKQPEPAAWDILMRWAADMDLLHSLEGRRFFGFNNPSPSAGSDNYGYEQWMTIGADEDVETTGNEGVEIKEFEGGLFAVTRCEIKESPEEMMQAWQRLAAWVEDSNYVFSGEPCLEELVNPEVLIRPVLDKTLANPEFSEFVFDLYESIAE